MFRVMNWFIKRFSRARKLLLCMLLLISALGLWCWQSQAPSVPDVTLKTIFNETLRLHDYRGKPIIVTFWASDCASCVAEIPLLSALYNQYHAQGLEIIAVAQSYDVPSHVVEMTKAHQIPYHVALDLSAHVAKAFGGVDFIPKTFLIASNGDIIMDYTGLQTYETLQVQVKRLLEG